MRRAPGHSRSDIALHAAQLRVRVHAVRVRRPAAGDGRPDAIAMTGLSAPVKRDGWLIAAVIVLLLGTACCFRLMRLSSVPGISGDEGFWGVQALAWLQGRPYVTHTTSGNPIDLVFLIPIAWLHAVW